MIKNSRILEHRIKQVGIEIDKLKKVFQSTSAQQHNNELRVKILETRYGQNNLASQVFPVEEYVAEAEEEPQRISGTPESVTEHPVVKLSLMV